MLYLSNEIYNAEWFDDPDASRVMISLLIEAMKQEAAGTKNAGLVKTNLELIALDTGMGMKETMIGIEMLIEMNEIKIFRNGRKISYGIHDYEKYIIRDNKNEQTQE